MWRDVLAAPCPSGGRRDGVKGVFPLISGPVTEQIRPLLKLKMRASLTSEAENLCSFIHLFLLLWFPGAQTGAVLGCEFFFSHLFNCTLNLAPPGMLQTLAWDQFGIWHFCPAWGQLCLAVSSSG